MDYLGIASDLKQALAFYSDAGGKGDPLLAQEKALQLLLEKIEVVAGMFHSRQRLTRAISLFRAKNTDQVSALRFAMFCNILRLRCNFGY